MRLNSSAPGPWVGRTGDPFTQPPSVLERALLAPGLGNGSGNLSESVPAAPSSDLDVNTDIYSKVLVTIVYLALFVVGTVGNSVTAFTLARKKSLQNLQSTVHYHLGSLALSDLLILLLAMPVKLYNFIWVHHPWAFGDAVCRGYYFLILSRYVTALFLALPRRRVGMCACGAQCPRTKFVQRRVPFSLSAWRGGAVGRGWDLRPL